MRAEAASEGRGDRQQSVREASGTRPLAALPDHQSGLWGLVLHGFDGTLSR